MTHSCDEGTHHNACDCREAMFAELGTERDRLREQHKACLAELAAIDDALGTNEGHSAVKHILKLREQVKVLQPVLDEVQRAIAKFPTWPTDPLHAVAVLGEEFGELTKAVLQYTYESHKTNQNEIRMEAIQTAAMAIRFLVSLDAYRFDPTAQHKQSALAATKEPE